MSNPIEVYALIGDCETVALVSRFGSVDWLCWPRFNDDSCFAALLGTPDHGCWRIGPEAAVTAARRRYQEDALVIETDAGVIRLMTSCPSGKRPHH